MAGQAILMDHLFGVGHRTSPFPKNSPPAGEFIGQGPVRRANGAGGDMRWASLRWVAWTSSNMSGSGRSKTFPSRSREGPGVGATPDLTRGSFSLGGCKPTRSAEHPAEHNELLRIPNAVLSMKKKNN